MMLTALKLFSEFIPFPLSPAFTRCLPHRQPLTSGVAAPFKGHYTDFTLHNIRIKKTKPLTSSTTDNIYKVDTATIMPPVGLCQG